MNDKLGQRASEFTGAWCVNIFCVYHEVMGTKTMVVAVADLDKDKKCSACGCAIHTGLQQEAHNFVAEVKKFL